MKLFSTCICNQYTTASGPAETILRRMHSELKQSIIGDILIFYAFYIFIEDMFLVRGRPTRAIGYSPWQIDAIILHVYLNLSPVG